MKRRFDILDAWRSLAVLLMLVYHFLYDLYIFRVITWEQMFCVPLNLTQKFICSSFILLAGMSARFSRSNLRHGCIVLAAGVAVVAGAAAGGQTIRFGILQFMGVSTPRGFCHGASLARPIFRCCPGCSCLRLAQRWAACAWSGGKTACCPRRCPPP